MADRYWVGGTAAWDTTAGIKWALTSGGVGGQAVPTTADDVYFDAASGTVTVTASSGINIKSIDCSGFTGSLAMSSPPTIYGNKFKLSSTMTYSQTANLTFLGGTGVTQTITTAGKTLGTVQFGNSAGTFELADAFACTTINILGGTFNTNNFAVTAQSLTSDGSSVRAINLGSSTVTLTTTSSAIRVGGTNLTFNAGTSQINLSQASSGSFEGGGLTFYNVTVTSDLSAAFTYSITGSNTFNNLTLPGTSNQGVGFISINAPQTINGTLTIRQGSNATCRTLLRTVLESMQSTIKCNSFATTSDVDFRDIAITGAAAPISGTRFGDCKGNLGVIFTTPKTVYWNRAAGGNWNETAWAISSGGTPDIVNFPLAQDTVIFESTGLSSGTVVTLQSGYPLGTINLSARSSNTVTIQISFGGTYSVYGNWINGTGVSTSGTQPLIFVGRNTQTITSAGRPISNSIIIDTYGGSVELADALNIGSNTLTVTNGTFDTKNYAVTAGSLSSSNSNVRGINLRSSTVTTDGNTACNFDDTRNLSFNAGTSTISTINALGSISVAFSSGAGLTFYNFNFNRVGSPTIRYTMTGSTTSNSTFNNITVTAPTTAGFAELLIIGNFTVNGTLTVAGATPTRRIFLRSNTIGTPRTLTVGSLSATDCDFRDITITGAAANSTPTRAGNCGGNSGITFPASKTVYWNLAGTQNWSATAWADVSGGTPGVNNFPLAQDVAVFDNAGAAGTVTIDQAFNISTFNASTRTAAMTFSTGFVDRHKFYGDFIAGLGITITSGGSLSEFAGDKLQTINMNGVAWGAGGVEVNKHRGTILQLASSLNIVNRAFDIVSGNFDAVSYNFTSSTFSAATNVGLRMGSGTWTFTGTGTIFTLFSNVTFYKGTADIILSSSSTASRIFNGNNYSYNKLTIGGTTGISTTTISGQNQFTELASTKTVAHTIDLGSTTQTFGKWTVSGTAGNVVTVNGGGSNHVIAGARVSGIDYVNMYVGFSTGSPGEFYAGANSVGTGTRVINTAAPAPTTRYWVGGSSNWDNATTTRWSATSGGPGGASVPTSADDVIFDAASSAGSYTVTLTATTGARCKSLTFAAPASGTVTWAGTAALYIHGNVTLPATGLTRTYTGAITLSGSAAGNTFTSNGVEFGNTIIVNGVGCEWTLGSAVSGVTDLTLTNGSFDLASYSFTGNRLLASNNNSRSIIFGSGVTTLSSNFPMNFGTTETARANLTVTSNTSQIIFSFSSASTLTFNGNNQTFYNVSFTGVVANGTVAITGQNTFNNLSVTGVTSQGLKTLSLTANQTINGTLTIAPGTNATMRTFVQSDILGTPRTLTCNAVTATDADFRDIVIAGAAAPVSGTRLGDCKGNSGITFDAPKTVYWNLAGNNSWSATAWAATAGATPSVNNFPLAQDTAVFTATSPASAATTTVNAAYNIGTIDMSARTANTLTLASGSSSPIIYGNWINGTGTTVTGAGTFLTFAGRTTQYVLSAGKYFPQYITIDSPEGSIVLQDSFTWSGVGGTAALTINRGTFDAAIYNVTLAGNSSQGGVSSDNTNKRTIAIGSGTWVITNIGGWIASTSTNLTVTGTGTISLTSSSNKSFAGGGISYSGITLDQGGAGTLTITGNNAFADITNTYSATGATTIALGNTTQRVGKFSASGTAGKVLTVRGSGIGSPATLIYTGAGEATAATTDYLNVVGVRAYNLANTWYAGNNSTNAGSLGWIFAAATVVATVASTFFLMF